MVKMRRMWGLRALSSMSICRWLLRRTAIADAIITLKMNRYRTSSSLHAGEFENTYRMTT